MNRTVEWLKTVRFQTLLTLREGAKISKQQGDWGPGDVQLLRKVNNEIRRRRRNGTNTGE